MQEEEKNKFEVLQVLNLLEKTDIHSIDLVKRSEQRSDNQANQQQNSSQILKSNAL